MEVSPILIEVDNLRKTYNFGRTVALAGVSLQISRGEIFGLIGPNGAGKTTLMGCLLALLKPTAGQIKIDGRTPDDLSIRQATGFLPERPSFDPWMTARQFLYYHHMLANQPGKTRRADIEQVLEKVELDKSVADRQVRKFSRGMLQRLGLAQVLIGRPKVCFLDEPASGMDPLGISLVRNLLLEWKRNEVTVILNSHHLDEVERVCDRVAFIRAGKIESIQVLNESEDRPLVFMVRWHSNNGNAPSPDQIELLAKQSQVELKECWDKGGRFVVDNRQAAASLLKQLVLADIAVEEAAFERQALADLFFGESTKVEDVSN
jgi:ABC-2 type transport system ATP-binding protein